LPKQAKCGGAARGAKNTKTPAKSTNSGITKGGTRSSAAPLKSALKKGGKSVSFAEGDLSEDSSPKSASAGVSATVEPVQKQAVEPKEVMVTCHVYLDSEDLDSSQGHHIEIVDVSLDSGPGYTKILQLAQDKVKAVMAVKEPGKMANWPLA
jgi:hypothetical protein